MTEAQRAAFRIAVALKEQTRTHYAPEPNYLRRQRGGMTSKDAMARARNGRRNGPQARKRKP